MKMNELKAEIVRKEMTLEEFADRADIPRTTMWRRFKKPEEFTLGEIQKIAEILDLTSRKVEYIFFNR